MSLDRFCCFRRLLEEQTRQDTKQGKLLREKRKQNQCNIMLHNKYFNMATNSSLVVFATTALLLTTTLFIRPINCFSTQREREESSIESYRSNHHPQHQSHAGSHHLTVAQPRVGGLDPSDYIDEASELEVLANQQQIPTSQLMAAAGHIVPENFFLPGGSIPAIYSRYQQAQQQQQQQQHNHQREQQHQQQQQQDQMQQVASHIQARHVAPPSKQYQAIRQADLIAAAAAEQQHSDNSPLIDYNGYNLVAAAAQQDPRDAAGAQTSAGQDMVDYLSSAGQQALYEQQQHQHFAEQQIAAELAALAAANNHHHHHHHQQQQQQQQQLVDNSASSSNDNSVIDSNEQYAASLGPAYQVSQHQDMVGSVYSGNEQQDRPAKPYGLPTKSSNKEPSGMLKPLGNPKTVSSPVIDFVANQLPKTSNFEKLAEKLPPVQTPTVFSFASSKDPSEKVKAVNQKKRNVMRQAEQVAKMMIKTINDKFGTTIGDQSDIPFLLSSLGPLGMAQNLLFDPTLLVALLNSAEKTYFSDVLPGPAKMAIRPVLNIFRVPNKKRDKANISNILSFLASGGQIPSSTQAKHRQGTGIEKSSKGKNRK